MRMKCNVTHPWRLCLIGLLLIMLTPLLAQGYTGVTAVINFQDPLDPEDYCHNGLAGIYLLDSQTNTTTGPFSFINSQIDPETGQQMIDECLQDYYGIVVPTRFAGGGLFDVVILPDGKTAAVSGFGDSTVLFIDISNPANPVKLSQVDIPFFAEDMALTPDGKYLLVTDGGFSPRIAVIGLWTTPELVQDFDLNAGVDPADPDAVYTYAQAVAVDRYNNVFVVDYFQRAVHVFHIDPATGVISRYNPMVTFDLIVYDDPEDPQEVIWSMNPVNITIDRDGDHLVAVSAYYELFDPLQWPDHYYESPAFAVFQSNGPGDVTMLQQVADLGAPIPEGGDASLQSAAYARDNTTFYSTLQDADAVLIVPPEPELPYYEERTTLRSLTVNPDGTLMPTGTGVLLTTRGTSSLFGVDTMNFEPTGQRLYISNPTLSGGEPDINVVDIATLQLSNIVLGDHLADYFPIPTGIDWQSVPTFTLWGNASTGQAEVWQINPEAGSVYATFALQNSAGWEAVSLVPNADGTFWVLWNRGTTGQSAVWKVNAAGVQLSAFAMQYTTGWQVTSVFPNADGTFWVLWSNATTGYSVIRHVNAAGTVLSAFPIGQSAGWAATSLVRNADGSFWVLWSNVSTGQGAIWQVAEMDESGGGISTFPLPSNSAGWEATSLFPAWGVFVVTWTNASTGQAQVWMVNDQGAKLADFPMQKTGGWRANGYEQGTQGFYTRPPAPPKNFILWTK